MVATTLLIDVVYVPTALCFATYEAHHIISIFSIL